MTVGIYYATTIEKTEDVADRLHNFISSAEAPKDVSDVDDLRIENLDGIICGILLGILVQMKKDRELHGFNLEEIGELSLSGKSCTFWFRRFLHLQKLL